MSNLDGVSLTEKVDIDYAFLTALFVSIKKSAQLHF